MFFRTILFNLRILEFFNSLKMSDYVELKNEREKWKRLLLLVEK